MKIKNNLSDSPDPAESKIVLSCSGASDLGELSDRLARKLRNNYAYSMKCLAMVAADDKKLIGALQKSKTLVIDGCDIDCGKKIMEEAWLSNYQYIRLTDYGFKKGQTSVTDELIETLYQQIISDGNSYSVVNERPVPAECCLEDTCDMFDFMSDHVGLKVLHPGGKRATRKLIGLLQPDTNSKVLDIACGKGRTSVYLAKKYGCRVVGIDILENSIEEAKKYARKNRVEHLVSFQVADAQNLPFETNEFDYTIAQAMLILVEDKIKVMREAKRVLKPGGKSGWLELSWKKQSTVEFVKAASDEICALCIANVETFEDWEAAFLEGSGSKADSFRFDMDFRGLGGIIRDEGIVNSLNVMFRYLTKRHIRNRMKKLNQFFLKYPEHIGYGMYLTTK